MNIKKWEISILDKEKATDIASKYNLPSLLAIMLNVRGIESEEEIQEILYSKEKLSDPFLMVDMDKAVERISRAIDEFEKIVVYGDYDADGITATAILFTYLEARGADVCYYIPQRDSEGYGMNISAVETIHEMGAGLIITVDNGIASVAEVKKANELGIDVVITDHHQPQQVLPDAVAIVDAHRKEDNSPFKDFSGAGVVIKLLIALENGDQQTILDEYADLAALGTVGDAVPLDKENRILVKHGIYTMENHVRPGILALLQNSSSSSTGITSTMLSYTVIPRVNATGRMSRPEWAVKLLVCEDEDEAFERVREIHDANLVRRQTESEIISQAISMIEKSDKIKYSRIMVVSGEGWHHGVVGIVASRITERYGKPTIVISFDGEFAKGSGRSVSGFSLFDAISYCKENLIRFGGHPMAAGITLNTSNINDFTKKINEYAILVSEKMPVPCVRIDCKLNVKGLSSDMPLQLKPLEPFGSGNPQPLFGLFGFDISAVTEVGEGQHLRISCTNAGRSIECMCFGTRLGELPYVVGDKIDMAVMLDTKHFRGEDKLTIIVREIKLSGIDIDRCIHSYRIYEKYKLGEKMTENDVDTITPGREDLALIYRKIKSKKLYVRGIQPLLKELGGDKFNLGKLLICTEILNETKIAQCEVVNEIFSAAVLPVSGKVDILSATVLKRLKKLILN